MKLWILRPIKGDPLWIPWYDKAFGFVIQAENEEAAREIAQSSGGDENGWENEDLAWSSSEHSTCRELLIQEGVSVVMRDYAAA
jgi:hypothetical protein